MKDVIVREITVKATKERVYKAITDPAEITLWFPDSIEDGTLEVGQSPLFLFNGGEHKSRTYIVAAEPYTYFAFRWVPGGHGILGDVLKVPNTLVEFRIEEVSDGTKVTVNESGFASLPSEVAQESLDQNTGGWEFMMGRLAGLLN